MGSYLWKIKTLLHYDNRVSILVLVDYGFLQGCMFDKGEFETLVSILVLVDYGFLPNPTFKYSHIIHRSFNPCFSGLWVLTFFEK